MLEEGGAHVILKGYVPPPWLLWMTCSFVSLPYMFYFPQSRTTF
jgi:hypothetical protein